MIRIVIARRSTVLLSIVLLSLSFTVYADVAVTPAGPFSASGELAMKKGRIPVSCHATFDGRVGGDGALRVTAVSFGGFNPLCKSIKALGLPWQGQIDSPRKLTVHDMQVKVRVPLLGGICGPGPVSLVWRNAEASASFEQVNLGPDCAMDGTMLTTPQVDIRHPSQAGAVTQSASSP